MIKSTKFIIIMILCLGLTACGKASSTDETHMDYNVDEIEQEVIRGNSSFAWDIFKQLSAEERQKSVFISPFSISTALTMTYQGARGETKDQMAEVLGYSGVDMGNINDTYRNYIRYITQLNNVDVNLGNSIWIRDGFPVQEDFINTNEKMYNSSVFERDFSNPETVNEINGWITKETNGKIEKMLNKPIKPSVKMFLINAIYFKGDWKEAFDKDKTVEESFQVAKDKEKSVPMMFKKDTVHYSEGTDFKAIEMPYKTGDVSMYAVLPREDITLESFVSNMNEQKWDKILSKMEEHKDVNISFPKFKVEYGVKELNHALKELGMTKAFENADFSGMSKANLKIGHVLHKAFIEVNEKGSEAAAATVVQMEESADSQPITFKADRPFLYVIADNKTDSILFMGTYYGE